MIGKDPGLGDRDVEGTQIDLDLTSLSEDLLMIPYSCGTSLRTG